MQLIAVLVVYDVTADRHRRVRFVFVPITLSSQGVIYSHTSTGTVCQYFEMAARCLKTGLPRRYVLTTVSPCLTNSYLELRPFHRDRAASIVVDAVDQLQEDLTSSASVVEHLRGSGKLSISMGVNDSA